MTAKSDKTKIKTYEALLQKALDNKDIIEEELCNEGRKWIKEVGIALNKKENSGFDILFHVVLEHPFYTQDELTNALNVLSNDKNVKIIQQELVSVEGDYESN